MFFYTSVTAIPMSVRFAGLLTNRTTPGISGAFPREAFVTVSMNETDARFTPFSAYSFCQDTVREVCRDDNRVVAQRGYLADHFDIPLPQHRGRGKEQEDLLLCQIVMVHQIDRCITR